jgi:hypothetical protein
MTTQSLRIRLTPKEAEYLNAANFLEQTQIEIIRQATFEAGTSAFLLITPELAERFRDAFTGELAKTGFDENYEVNADGRLLEDLIDRFHAKSG